MAIVDALLQELEQEAATTRRVLEIVPSDKLGWKPHPKSMSLGQLALHVAVIPGAIAELVREPREVPKFAQAEATSTAEVLQALDKSLADARRILPTYDDAAMMAPWHLMRGSQAVMTAPRVGVLRSIMLNHWYHHRGQLSVYLRQLDVPLPSIYGPSADVNPFG
jgi:uncharacterized damage-inducible protein DinB